MILDRSSACAGANKRSRRPDHSMHDRAEILRPTNNETMSTEMIINSISNAPDAAQSTAGTLRRCEHALELVLTHRGNPSAEVDRVLADDPQCVLGHCLRSALIVLADDARARSTLAARLAVIEAASTNKNEPARRPA